MPVDIPTEPYKLALYQDFEQELSAVLSQNRDPLIAMVTFNALIKKHIPYAYWVGFYLAQGSRLTVGPYQGTLGCLEIPAGKGVCGASFASNSPIVVESTHDFEGHIACDPKSLSEIVIPYYGTDEVHRKGEAHTTGEALAKVSDKGPQLDRQRPLGVLDVDSASLGSFDTVDQLRLSQCLERYLSPWLCASTSEDVARI